MIAVPAITEANPDQGMPGEAQFLTMFCRLNEARQNACRAAAPANTPTDRPHWTRCSSGSPCQPRNSATTCWDPVLACAGRRLERDTLEAWIRAEGSTAEAGRSLHCHRNNAGYRLGRIAEITGRSVSRPAEAAELYAAFRSVRLLAQSPLAER